MIQYNPLLKRNGNPNGPITTAPSDSIVFDLPGRATWVKGVRLSGTDHIYTFEHDSYITLTNTPGLDQSEVIKIGANIAALKAVIDTTYDVVTRTKDGLAPRFDGFNVGRGDDKAAHYFLGLQGNVPRWFEQPHRRLEINNVETLGAYDISPISFVAGNGITLSWDNQQKKIVIVNNKPDINHNTDYRVNQAPTSSDQEYRLLFKYMADDIAEISSTYFSPYLTFNADQRALKIDNLKVVTVGDVMKGASVLLDGEIGLVPKPLAGEQLKFLRADGTWALPISIGDTWRHVKINNTTVLGNDVSTGPLTFSPGDGIQISWDSFNSRILITNTKPDINHNVTTTAVVANTSSSIYQIISVLPDPFYNLIEGGSVSRSIQFKSGDGIEVIANANGVITFTNTKPDVNHNITTTAVIANTSSSVVHTEAPIANPFYNLIEGGLVTRSIQFLAGDGISIVSGANGTISIQNTKPDVNHNITTSAVIANSSSSVNRIAMVQPNPYYNLLEGGQVTHSMQFKGGTGISITADTNGALTITNTAPDVNHNTDYRVTQSSILGNQGYYVLLKKTADEISETASVNFSTTLKYNPSLRALLINGYKVVTFQDVMTGATTLSDGEAGLVPKPLAGVVGRFLRCDGTWQPLTNDTWRGVRINNDNSNRLGTGTDTGPLIISQGDGIEVAWDNTNKKIIITNTAPDVNHNVTTSAVLATSSINTSHITQNRTNPYYNLIEGNQVTRSIQLIGGDGISVTAASNGKITIVNESPDVNHNITTSAVLASSASGTTQINSAQVNPFYNLLEGGIVTRSIQFAAGTGISISASNTGKITITNTSPDYNHNTDHYVNQSGSSSSNYRGVLLTYRSSSTANSGIETNTTDVVYTSNKLTVQPSTGNVASMGYMYAAHYYETSDRAKKDNIEAVSEHIRKFTLKSSGKQAYGVIAQEVPEMFRDGEEGNLTVNYNSILSYYVAMLENRVKYLENKLLELNEKL